MKKSMKVKLYKLYWKTLRNLYAEAGIGPARVFQPKKEAKALAETLKRKWGL